MRIALCLFGVEVVVVEVELTGRDPDDVDLSDYEISSDTERFDVEAWREDADEDAEHPPRIIAAGHRSRRRRAPVIAIGSKHRGANPHSSVDTNRNTRAAAGFGFTPRG